MSGLAGGWLGGGGRASQWRLFDLLSSVVTGAVSRVPASPLCSGRRAQMREERRRRLTPKPTHDRTGEGERGEMDDMRVQYIWVPLFLLPVVGDEGPEDAEEQPIKRSRGEDRSHHKQASALASMQASRGCKWDLSLWLCARTVHEGGWQPCVLGECGERRCGRDFSACLLRSHLLV